MISVKKAHHVGGHLIDIEFSDGVSGVVATERGANLRIISARLASRRERKQYEEAD